MIQTLTISVPNEIEIICGDAATINFILNLYPTKNLKFMDGPVGLSVDGTPVEAMTLKSNYRPSELPVVDVSTISNLSDHVQAILDEFFEYVGDKEIYLYGVILGIHGCKVRAYFAQ